VDSATSDYDQQAPLSRGTLLSRLVPYIEDPGHSEATIPWEDRYRIHCWIDANIPFYSHYTQMSPTILSAVNPLLRPSIAFLPPRIAADSKGSVPSMSLTSGSRSVICECMFQNPGST